MSNPTDIEVAGAPAWMVDETPATTSTPATNSSDDVIRAPTRSKKASATVEIATPSSTTKPQTDNGNIGNTPPSSAAEAAAQKTWSQYFSEGFRRDGRLLLVTVGILICMNIPYVKYALYPFDIYSTWIHELGHGLAALMVGGSVSKLEIFPDTSGLAYTGLPSLDRRGFVASAGYQGTAFMGFTLLLFRRTKRGPRFGTMAIALSMMLTCIMWIRNAFGFWFLFCMGLVLFLLGLFLPSTHIRNVYICLAVTCSLNAITSVHDLFGLNAYVNGQPSSTDAHTMEEYVGGSFIFWAILWLTLAIVLTILGIVFAIPGPDEVADFACCGTCQDWGLFTLFNYPGQRWCRKTADTPNGEGPAGP